MLNLVPSLEDGSPLRLLCIGAHSDDLEIGCGGTLLSWLGSSRPVHVTWVVLTATGERAAEARRSATDLLDRASAVDIVLGDFADGFLPSQYEAVKAFFESLKRRAAPDIVLTHRLEDRHQDHRLAAELSWNTWRESLRPADGADRAAQVGASAAALRQPALQELVHRRELHRAGAPARPGVPLAQRLGRGLPWAQTAPCPAIRLIP
jgi:LmbE family N-acetylglucosaminyl deacetylase